jgi:WD40 repeat protein
MKRFWQIGTFGTNCIELKKVLLILLLLLPVYFFAQQPQLVLPVGHTNTINKIIFSPDNKKVITVSDDQTARIWDANTGMLLSVLSSNNAIDGAALSPEGSTIVTYGEVSQVKLWNLNKGTYIRQFGKGAIYWGKMAQFNPDGKKLLVVSGSRVNIFDVESGTLLHELGLHSGFVNSAFFNSDGTRILTASNDGTAIIWNIMTGDSIHTLKGHTGEIEYAEFSKDDNKIVTASKDSTVKIWNSKTGKLIITLRGHTNDVARAYFSPDGTKILSYCVSVRAAIKDNNAKLWDVQSGKLLYDFSNDYQIGAACFGPGGKSVFTGDKAGVIRVWNSLTGALTSQVKTDWPVTDISFSPDGKKMGTASYNGFAKIYDVRTGTELQSLVGHINNVLYLKNIPGSNYLAFNTKNAINILDLSQGIIDRIGVDTALLNYFAFSDIGNLVAAQYNDGKIKVWSFPDGKSIPINKFKHGFYLRTISPAGKHIALSDGFGIAIWNMERGEINELKGRHAGTITSMEFSPDENWLISGARDNTFKIWNLKNGELTDSLPGPNVKDKRGNDNLSIIKGKKYFVTTNFLYPDSVFRIWEFENFRLVKEVNNRSRINSISISGNDKMIAVSSYGNINIWDIQTGLQIGNIKDPSDINEAVFSNFGDKILLTSWNNRSIKLWDYKKDTLLSVLRPAYGSFYSPHFSVLDQDIVNIWDNFWITIWDAKSITLKALLVNLDSTDYFIQILSGYYQCSPNAAKLLHYVTKDLKVITFEQLDVKYNRPDKVLEAIGNTDTALIKSYRIAWEKRIKKLGIDTTFFKAGYSVPEADFVNRDRIDYEQKKEILSLHIRGNDSTYLLERFNVWINEVPVYGQRGINIRHRNKNSFDTTITIRLSQGENRIETSLFNVNGTESYRMPLTVNYTPEKPQKEIAHFVGIGIQQFADKSHPLKYSVKDIRDLALKLKEKYGNDITIDTLFNENVSIGKVKRLKEKLKQTSINDKVIIAYSGHGLLSDSLDYYLSTYSVNFNNPQENGLPYDELENLLDSIPARKKLMLIDACHSGEVDKEERMIMDKQALSLGLGKGIDPESTVDTKHLGLNNSFALMQSLFVNVGKSTGATIIAAAGGNQYALEGVDKLPNGVFTHCILEEMKNNETIKVSELKKQVGRRVEEITKGLQKPTSRNETIAVDWKVW